MLCLQLCSRRGWVTVSRTVPCLQYIFHFAWTDISQTQRQAKLYCLSVAFQAVRSRVSFSYSSMYTYSSFQYSIFFTLHRSWKYILWSDISQTQRQIKFFCTSVCSFAGGEGGGQLFVQFHVVQRLCHVEDRHLLSYLDIKCKSYVVILSMNIFFIYIFF